MRTVSTSHLAGKFWAGRANSCPVTTSSKAKSRLKRPWIVMLVFLRLPSNSPLGAEGSPATQMTAQPRNSGVSNSTLLQPRRTQCQSMALNTCTHVTSSPWTWC